MAVAKSTVKPALKKPVLAVAKATPAPAKPVPAAKAAPAGEKVPRASRIAGELEGKKLTILVPENPKREGSASHARFALYKNGMTYEACLAAGITNGDVHWDLAHEFIAFK
jgi:hypothetical protein